ncbi:MAG TPA: hypothetical protein VEN81_00630 [Planctomycetota bacterium]|nr:hypothetical protein [Planctomycetota bacterium]
MKVRGILALAGAAVLLPCCTTNIGKGDQLAEVTVRLSVLQDESQVTAPATATPFSDGSLNASISDDGRFVAFESTSDEFVQGDTNGLRDIIVKDRWTGATENITLLRISGLVQRFGPRAADCFNPCISGNGRFVAFESTGIYVGGVQYLGTFLNIWVYDRQNQTFANATLNGNPGMNGDCTSPRLSYDGRFVVWLSAATNVQSQVGGGTTYGIEDFPPPFAPGTPATPQVYMTDLSMPAGDIITLVSHNVNSTTTGCNGSCTSPVISGDGTVVAFGTEGNDLLAAGDTDTMYDVYLRTIATDAIELVDLAINPLTSLTEKANGGAGAAAVAISHDGRYVTFGCGSSNWGFANFLNIVRRDRTLGVTDLVAAGNSTGYLSISGDGTRIAYVLPGAQITYTDMLTGNSRVVSVNISGAVANNTCIVCSISGNGQWIVWHTLADNLVADDTNGQNDVFARGPMGP